MGEYLKFYGLNDHATYMSGARITELVDAFDKTKTDHTINEIIQLYNLSLFIKNEVYPKDVTEQQKNKIKSLTPDLKRIISAFFGSLNSQNFSSTIKDVSLEYHKYLLELLASHKVYEKVTAENFLKVAKTNHVSLRTILTQEKIVKTYDTSIKSSLMTNSHSADYLIQANLLGNEREKIHFPSSFTKDDAHVLIERYIDSEDANPNFLELIASSGENAQIGIDAKLILKAKRKHTKWTDEFFKNNNNGIEMGCEVSITKNQTEEIEATIDGYITKLSFSREWLEHTLDYPSLLNNFIHLFGFTDSRMMLSLASYQSEQSTLEGVFTTRGKKDYPTNEVFKHKEQCSFLETAIYEGFLKHNDISLEDVIAWFFTDYLKNEFKVDGFEFSASTKSSTYLEKSRHLFSEMESAVKQFRLYVEEDGEIDPELLSITSGAVSYKGLPSLLDGKYLYLTQDQSIRDIQYLLFSDQSSVSYIDDTLKGDTFLKLLVHNEISYDNFHDHQKPTIDFLLSQGIIENVGQKLSFGNESQIIILKHIHEQESVNYYHYSDQMRTEADVMVAKGWLKKVSSLLSSAEASYFNYYLNKSEFSNGPDLRNTYLHGTQMRAVDHEEHYATYITALKLMIILVIKINDEFCLKKG